MAHLNPLSLRQRLALGALFVGVGLFPFLAAFGVGPLAAEINGPPWLGAAAGSVFMAGGLALSLGQRSSAMSALLALVIVSGLAAIAHWIAFGAGARVCSGSFTSPLFSQESLSSGLGCRIPFGYAALTVDAFLLVAVARLLQKSVGGPPRLAWLETTAKGALLVVLSPLLVLLFLLTAGRALTARLGRRSIDS